MGSGVRFDAQGFPMAGEGDPVITAAKKPKVQSFLLGLFAGHDPGHDPARGSGEEVSKISRGESGRVSRSSRYLGSGRVRKPSNFTGSVGSTLPDPREITLAEKIPAFFFVVFLFLSDKPVGTIWSVCRNSFFPRRCCCSQII